MFSQALSVRGGVTCVTGDSVCGREGVCGGGHAWQGGMCGRGHAWQGACMAGCVCMSGGVNGGHVGWGEGIWQERQPVQQAVHILLEYILIKEIYSKCKILKVTTCQEVMFEKGLIHLTLCWWLSYIATSGFPFWFQFGLQTKWPHCHILNFSYRMKSNSNSHPNFWLQEWNWDWGPNQNLPLWM